MVVPLGRWWNACPTKVIVSENVIMWRTGCRNFFLLLDSDGVVYSPKFPAISRRYSRLPQPYYAQIWLCGLWLGIVGLFIVLPLNKNGMFGTLDWKKYWKKRIGLWASNKEDSTRTYFLRQFLQPLRTRTKHRYWGWLLLAHMFILYILSEGPAAEKSGLQ